MNEAITEVKLHGAILENLQQGVVCFDEEGIVHFLNTFAAKALGVDRTVHVGKHVSSLKIDIPIHQPAFFIATVTRKGRWCCERAMAHNHDQSKPFRICASVCNVGARPLCVLVFEDLSEVWQLKAQLSERELQFKTISQYAEDAESWFSSDGELIWVNQATVKLTGYSVPELLCMQKCKTFLCSLAHKEDHDSVHAAITTMFETHSNGAGLECRLIKKDQTVCWVECSWQTLLDERGHCIGFRTGEKDITRRKKAQEELREQEMFVSELLDKMPMPVFFKDTSYAIRLCNRAFSEQVVGRPTKEIVGKRASDLVDCIGAGNISMVMERDQELMADGGVQHYESHINCADGIERGFLITKSLVLDDLGKAKGILGVLLDITERQKVEAELGASEERLRHIISTAAAGYFRLDHEGNFTEANDAMSVILGVASRSELLGKPLEAFLFPHEALRYQQQFGLLLLGDSLPNTEIVMRRNNGATVHVSCCLQAVNHNGTIEAVDGFAIDVSAVRSLQSQLSQSQKLEAIGNLAAGIAHEINSPLQFVTDNTSFVEKSFKGLLDLGRVVASLPLEGAPKEVCEQALRELHQVSQLVDIEFMAEEIPQAFKDTHEGLTRVTKIVRAMKEFSHPGTADKEPSDINRAVENTLTVSRNEWKYVADIVTQFDPAIPPVRCHVSRVNQAVLNIIVNAAQAIGESQAGREGKRGRITVTTKNLGEQVEIRISDTGPGIPEYIRGRIFDPFFTTKEAGVGSGQGLAIAQSIIVEQHGGKISCDSELDKGTTFVIHLPIGEVSQ